MKIATTTSGAVAKLGMEAGIRMLCGAGYDALDLMMGDMAKNPRSPWLRDDYRAYAQNVRSLANDCGVFFAQAHAPNAFRWAEPGVIEGIARSVIIRSMEIASIIGSPCITVHPLHHLPYRGHEQEMHELNIAYYRAFIPYCETFGIRIAVENMFQRDARRGCIVDDVGSRGETLAALVDDLRTLAPDCFTACLDLGHCSLVGEEAQEAIRILGADRLGCLHVQDNDYRNDMHSVPGTGLMDWTAITDALREIGYRGVFTYEADKFLRKFPPALCPDAAKFMADVARHWAAKCDEYSLEEL